MRISDLRVGSLSFGFKVLERDRGPEEEHGQMTALVVPEGKEGLRCCRCLRSPRKCLHVEAVRIYGYMV